MARSSFDHFIPSFIGLLKRADPGQLKEEYPRRYLQHLLLHKKYFLSIYSQLLHEACSSAKLDPSQSSFIDYGAGNGLLGLFAKHCGFNQVYINDLDKDFLHAARMLSAQLNIQVDGFIEGDINAVKDYPFNKVPSIIAGTDVIEHIYDLDHLFEEIKNINQGMVSVFTTASNPANKIKVKQLMALQQKDEWEGSDGNNTADPTAHLSYYSIRKQIISNKWPEIREKELDILSKATRGLVKKDIESVIDGYLRHGEIPLPISHPTNTCHPVTGSWTERILSIKEYEEIYDKHGFMLKVYNGFYNDKDGGLKQIVNKLLNGIVSIMGKNFSPFIGLIGTRK